MLLSEHLFCFEFLYVTVVTGQTNGQGYKLDGIDLKGHSNRQN